MTREQAIKELISVIPIGRNQTDRYIEHLIQIINHKSTLEEVKKEWEALGYKWKEDEIFITLIKQKYSKSIKINKKLKDYKCYDLFMTPTLLHTNNIALFITFQEHQLLHKLFEIWGWFDE